MSKNYTKKSILLAIIPLLLSCNSGMEMTRVADLSDQILSTVDKEEAFLVKNYVNDAERNDELYYFAKEKWLRYSTTYKTYKVEFIKESNYINLQSIHKVNSFNDYPLIDSLNKSSIVRYYFVNDTVTTEKVRNGQIFFSSKKKI